MWEDILKRRKGSYIGNILRRQRKPDTPFNPFKDNKGVSEAREAKRKEAAKKRKKDKDIKKDSAHTRRDRDVQNEYITRARKIRNMPRDEEFVKAAEEYLKRYKATFGNTIGGTGFRYVSIMGEIEKDNLVQSLKWYKDEKSD
jgi:hypothetical protein